MELTPNDRMMMEGAAVYEAIERGEFADRPEAVREALSEGWSRAHGGDEGWLASKGIKG